MLTTKRSFPDGIRDTFSEGQQRQYQKLYSSGRSKLLNVFSGRMEKLRKGLVCGYRFLSLNHLFEESLDAVNASRKPKSLLWLSEGLQTSS